MEKRLGLALLGAACTGIWALWPATQRFEPLTITSQGPEAASDRPAPPGAVERRPRSTQLRHSALSLRASLPPSAAEVPVVVEPPAPEAQAAPPKSSAELEAEYEARFQADRDGSPPSRQLEARLVATLARPELAGSALLGLRCRASLCRMELHHRDLSAREHFSEAFPLTVPWQTTGLVRFLDDFTSVIYLSTPL